MRKLICVFLLASLLSIKCYAQRDIIYIFDSSVIDSIQIGIDNYASLLKRKQNELKIYAVLVESNGQYEIYLQEYSHMPKGGFLDLLKTSNRKLQNKSKLVIPVIFTADINSAQIKGDKISYIPLSGFYIRVVVEDGKQKVVQTSSLF